MPALRYFYEERGDLAVVAAGSLLEFLLADHKFSMPVGRIEYLHMGPLVFTEYLNALGEANLRGGYKVDYDTEGLCFGGGVHTDLSGWPISVDYSYGKMSEYLNTVHRISLGVQFR